jgi:hypothetical protein
MQPPAAPVDPAALQKLLDGPYRDLRNKIRERQCRKEFARDARAGQG